MKIVPDGEQGGWWVGGRRQLPFLLRENRRGTRPNQWRDASGTHTHKSVNQRTEREVGAGETLAGGAKAGSRGSRGGRSRGPCRRKTKGGRDKEISGGGRDGKQLGRDAIAAQMPVKVGRGVRGPRAPSGPADRLVVALALLPLLAPAGAGKRRAVTGRWRPRGQQPQHTPRWRRGPCPGGLPCGTHQPNMPRRPFFLRPSSSTETWDDWESDAMLALTFREGECRKGWVLQVRLWTRGRGPVTTKGLLLPTWLAICAWLALIWAWAPRATAG